MSDILLYCYIDRH